MTINTAPAARDLTAPRNVVGLPTAASFFRAAKVRFFAVGGRVNVYGPGASFSDQPIAQYVERRGKKEFVA